MAITIMGGLLVATVLTLLVVPALYALWFRVRRDEPLAPMVPVEADTFETGAEASAMPIAAE
jgi:multidrug efflux pump